MGREEGDAPSFLLNYQKVNNVTKLSFSWSSQSFHKNSTQKSESGLKQFKKLYYSILLLSHLKFHITSGSFLFVSFHRQLVPLHGLAKIRRGTASF